MGPRPSLWDGIDLRTLYKCAQGNPCKQQGSNNNRARLFLEIERLFTKAVYQINRHRNSNPPPNVIFNHAETEVVWWRMN